MSSRVSGSGSDFASSSLVWSRGAGSAGRSLFELDLECRLLSCALAVFIVEVLVIRLRGGSPGTALCCVAVCGGVINRLDGWLWEVMGGEEIEKITLVVAFTGVLEPAPVAVFSLRQSMIAAVEPRGGGRVDESDAR